MLVPVFYDDYKVILLMHRSIITFNDYECFEDGGGGHLGDGAIISAHQAGNVLAINSFGTDTKIDCSFSFTLVQ
jgi:hypothetical protein